VINAALMRMRQKGRRVVISVDDRASDEDEPYLADVLRDMSPDPEAMYARKEALELIRRRLQRLPQPYLKIVWLRDIEGFTIQETANTLGVSRGTIKSTLHRARAKLAGLATTTRGKHSVRVARIEADQAGRAESEFVDSGDHLEVPPSATLYVQARRGGEMAAPCT
jgi:predicted DNA-binding protein (UPF0251 family)